MIDRFSAGMGNISASLLRTQKQADEFHAKMKGLAVSMQAMSAFKSVGEDMFKFGAGGLAAVIEPAKEYVHVLNQMNMAGVKQSEIAKNVRTAWEVAGKMPMTTPTSNLKAINDLSNFFIKKGGDFSEARELLPSFMRSQLIFEGISENKVDAHTQVYSMAKALEMIGAVNNRKDFEHQQNMMNRVAVATGGKVLPSHYQNVFKYARQGKLTLSDDFKYKILPELIMEMQSGGGGAGGGGGPGAMIAAAMRIGVQGIMSVATAGNLEKLGLLKSHVVKTTTTGTQVMGFDGVTDSKMFSKNPEAWVQKYMLPAMLKQDPSLKNDPLGQALRVAQIFKGNQMAVALLQELVNKHQQFGRFGEKLDRVPGSEELGKRALNSPNVADKAFDAALETLKISIGKNVVPYIVPALLKLSEALGAVGQYFNSHPGQAKAVAAILGSIAAVGLYVSALMGITIPFVVLGAVAATLGVGLGVVAAGFAAVFVGVIIAVGVVAGLIWVVLNWSRVSKTLTRVLNQGISVFYNVQVAFLQMLSAMVSGVAGAAGMINGFVSGISQGMFQLPMAQINAVAGIAQASLNAQIKTAQDNSALHGKAGGRMVAPGEKLKLAPGGFTAVKRSAPAGGSFTPLAKHGAGGGTQVGSINFNIKSTDPKAAYHEVKKAVKEVLGDIGKNAPKTHTRSGGSYNSYAHGT